MTDDNEGPQGLEPKRPLAQDASYEDMASLEIDPLLTGAPYTDYHQLERDLERNGAKKNELASHRAAALLAGICSFYMRPESIAEPYGPMMVMKDRRTMIPTDLTSDQIKAIDHASARTDCSLLVGRLKDVVWHLDRSRVDAAHSAIDAYCKSVDLILGSPPQEEREFRNLHSEKLLRRALVIAHSVPSASLNRLTQLCCKLRDLSFTEKHAWDFLRASKMLVDFGLQSPAEIGRTAEQMISVLGGSDYRAFTDLWSHAARAYQIAGEKEEERRCILECAEWHVRAADQANLAMIAASHLEEALDELRSTSGTKERRTELQHRIVDVQARIADEMSPFTYELNLSGIAESAINEVSGVSLMAALGIFASMFRSPDPQELRREAVAQIREFPLQSLFAGVTVDERGKPLHRSSGGGLGDENNESAIRHAIARSEQLRRQFVAEGGIRNAWLAIVKEHRVDELCLRIIVENSDFVPADREEVFLMGLLRFFQGDLISACSILIPQIENSLRDILRARGVQVNRFNNDQTQEDMSLPMLMQKCRLELLDIFGEALVEELESILTYRAGPNLRHKLAHGLLTASALYSPDARYLCWLVFRLCCLPLFQDWNELTTHYNEQQGKNR